MKKRTCVKPGATYYSMYVLHDMGNMSRLAATAFAPSIVIRFLGPWLIGKKFSDRDGQVEIPEEVLSTPVKADGTDEFSLAGILDFLADALGRNEE